MNGPHLTLSRLSFVSPFLPFILIFHFVSQSFSLFHQRSFFSLLLCLHRSVVTTFVSLISSDFLSFFPFALFASVKIKV